MTAEDPLDNATDWLPTRTPERLHVLRDEAVTSYAAATGEAITQFTCDNCRDAPRCPYAFDPYNTDGDCLGSK